MSNIDESSDGAELPATDEPRWHVSLVELFSAITSVAVLLGFTHWLSRGFATGARIRRRFALACPRELRCSFARLVIGTHVGGAVACCIGFGCDQPWLAGKC